LWDSLVVAIGINASNLIFDDVFSSLLSEEMRKKKIEGQSKMPYLQEDALGKK
jgi:hypothetical protein